MGPLTPYLLYIKIAAGVVLMAVLFGSGYHLGGASQRDGDDKRAAAQLSKVVTVMEQRQAAAEAEVTRRQGIIDAYDRIKSVPSPIVAGLGQRVLIYSRGPGCPALPGPITVAGGTADTAAQPASDEGTQRLSELNQSVYDACAADAKQMTAMEALARAPTDAVGVNPPR